MIEIIPAIMPTDTGDLEAKLAQVAGHASVVQIDIMDGKFVKNVSWPYTEHESYFKNILNEGAGMPYWDQFDFEIDLMILHPEKVVEDWIAAGARRIIVHQESLSIEDFEKLIESFRKRFPRNEKPDVFDVEIGLAQNIDTPSESLFPYLDKVDFVQFMGIAEIGVQGNPFDERVLDKIRALRARSPEVIITVDGAVSLETAPQLIEAGVNRLVVGSAIFKSADVHGTIKEFKLLGK